MMRALSIITALTVFLASCGQGQQTTADGGDSDDPRALCKKIGGLLLAGQRNSFGLQFAEAENAFTELLTIYSLKNVKETCPRAPSQPFVMMNQALALSSQERFVTADGLFSKAGELLKTLDYATVDEKARDEALFRSYQAQDLLNRSSVLGSNEFEQAAVLAFPELDGDGDGFETTIFELSDERKKEIIDQATNQHAFSHIQLLKGDTKGALESINASLDLVSLVPQSAAVYRPRFLAQRALIYYEGRQYRKALTDAEAAAKQFGALMPGSPLEARALLSHARALAAVSRFDDALAAYERGFAIYEESPVIVEYKALWPFFRLALKMADEDPSRRQELAARMFRAAQVIRRSITAATVSGAAALLGEGGGDKADAVRAWRDASERYATLKALQVIQLQDPLAQPEQIEAIAKRVAAAQTKVELLQAERDRVAPEYQSAISSPVSLKEVQEGLIDGEALIQVVSGAPRSLVFVIDRNGIDVSDVRATETQLAVLVARLRKAVEAGPDGVVPIYRADFAFVLYNLMFRKLDEQLAKYDSLIFATTGALQSFPLELLVTKPVGNPREADWVQKGDYTSLTFLGATKAISYVPSPRNLVDVRLKAGRSSAARDVAAFGDFRSGVDPQKVIDIAELPAECLGLAKAINRIGDLPGTATEVTAITAPFGENARLRMAENFTEGALKKASESGELADFKVLHFATHGILWPTPDCFTDPALTVTATDDPQSDGLLTATEIRGLNLDAQLIILSACNTASTYLEGIGNAAAQKGRKVTGKAAASNIIRESGAGGESLSGLARAFFSAGARTVLATHWPVSDEETTKLMQIFYGKLREDRLNLAAALRAAQGELRSDPKTSHPIFWGPFVLIGDGSLTLDAEGS
ncbi:MAG: CHAT domain-containing protein [Pikeienuella sp.]